MWNQSPKLHNLPSTSQSDLLALKNDYLYGTTNLGREKSNNNNQKKKTCVSARRKKMTGNIETKILIMTKRVIELWVIFIAFFIV